MQTLDGRLLHVKVDQIISPKYKKIVPNEGTEGTAALSLAFAARPPPSPPHRGLASNALCCRHAHQ